MEFRLLGPLEVIHDGRPLAVGGAREREVLALLLLAPNRVVSADRLVEDLWAVAGIAAAAGRDWTAAETHFAAALRIAEELPHRLEATETHRFRAQMLLERGTRDDRARAAVLLAEAEAGYADIGMPRHVELVRRLIRED